MGTRASARRSRARCQMGVFQVVLLPGSVLPADSAYGGLVEALGADVDPIVKDLEVYREETPPTDYSLDTEVDRKSTRLNSSHTVISYAVFCLKKKKNKTHHERDVHQTKSAERQVGTATHGRRR